MPNNLRAQWQPANPETLAKQFSRLGRIDFWIQLALISIPNHPADLCHVL